MNTVSIYETSELVEQYLLFHYGEPEEILPYSFGPRDALNFAQRCVTETFNLDTIGSNLRALDLGCAVGRSSFELSRFCQEVVAIDSSKAFIEAAQLLQRNGSLNYRRSDEGPLKTDLTAKLPAGCVVERVAFRCGDALEANPADGQFDLVLAANLIDRVSDPTRLLQTFAERIVSGGQLVITSPYTWLTEFTPRSAWLSGKGEHGRESALERMEAVLANNFRLAAVRDLPFLIREHARKFQWSVAQASRWTRL